MSLSIFKGTINKNGESFCFCFNSCMFEFQKDCLHAGLCIGLLYISFSPTAELRDLPLADNLRFKLSQLNTHYLNSVSHLNGDFYRRKLQTTKLKTDFTILVRARNAVNSLFIKYFVFI
jgi:hypothetical protein